MAAIKLKFGFIPFPLAIVDEAADLSLGEYRLLGYLLRHQFRVKTDVVVVKQDELLCGVWKPSGRERWDQGCGITSPRDLKAARVALEARGWLKVTTTTVGMTYQLCLAADDEEDDADAGPDSAADPGARLADAASAKCTQENVAARVQNAPESECILSTFRVQNALVDIRKEKVLEGSTRKNPPSPQRGVDGSGSEVRGSRGEEQKPMLADLILGRDEGQRQKHPGEGKSKKELRVMALRAGVDAELEDLEERVRPRNDAVAKVLRECGLADPRGRGMTRVVGAAMDLHFERSDEPRNWNALAEAMIVAYEDFLKIGHLLRYRVGPKTFFAGGMWNDDRKWPWDQKAVRENRQSRVGTSRQGSGAQAAADVVGWKEQWERERAQG